jgi:hypothetical protein
MKIVHQTDRALEVFVPGRTSALLGLAAVGVGVIALWFGWRGGAVLPLAVGTFVAAMGAGSIWTARDIHHVLDADRGTATVTKRRLFGGGARRTETTVYELSQVADVELQERRGSSRARRRGRRHPTWRLAYRFHDGRVEPWSDVHSSNRASHDACLTAARTVLHTHRASHSRYA